MDVSKEKCDFIISKERREVICILRHTKYAFDTYLRNLYERLPLYWSCDEEKFNMPEYFIGVATCAPEDKWDEELGKDIAYSKALKKFNKSFFKRAKRYSDLANQYCKDIYNTLNEYQVKIHYHEQERDKWLNDRIKLHTYWFK